MMMMMLMNGGHGIIRARQQQALQRWWISVTQHIFIINTAVGSASARQSGATNTQRHCASPPVLLADAVRLSTTARQLEKECIEARRNQQLQHHESSWNSTTCTNNHRQQHHRYYHSSSLPLCSSSYTAAASLLQDHHHTQHSRRYRRCSSSTKNESAEQEEEEKKATVANKDDSSSAGVTLNDIPGSKAGTSRKLAILFTCAICETRSMKKFSESAPVVIVRCPGCQNLHLLVDRLGWFADDEHGKTFDIIQQAAQNNQRKSVNDDGVLELTLEELVGSQEKVQELLLQGENNTTVSPISDDMSEVVKKEE
jgi:DNL zinc finger